MKKCISEIVEQKNNIDFKKVVKYCAIGTAVATGLLLIGSWLFINGKCYDDDDNVLDSEEFEKMVDQLVEDEEGCVEGDFDEEEV